MYVHMHMHIFFYIPRCLVYTNVRAYAYTYYARKTQYLGVHNTMSKLVSYKARSLAFARATIFWFGTTTLIVSAPDGYI